MMISLLGTRWIHHTGKDVSLRRNGGGLQDQPQTRRGTMEVTVGYRMYETGSTSTASLLPGWTPGTVTFSAQQSTATLTFDTVNDPTKEEDSELGGTLHVDAYPDEVTLDEPAVAYVTVLDDGGDP